MHRLLPFVLCVLSLVAWTSSALAQDAQQAQELFLEAKRDVEAGRVELACPKFQSAFESSGVIGALLSWADCEERRAHLLSARTLWQRGYAASQADPERQQFIRERLASLEPRIPTISLVDAAGWTIALDGRSWSGVGPLQVDPGPHRLTIEQGVDKRTLELDLREGETRPISLGPARTAIAAPKPAPISTVLDQEDNGANLRLVGWLVGGLGVAAGLSFAGTAIAVATGCPDWTCPSDYQPTLVANAVLGGTGVAALTVGAVLLGVGYGRGDQATKTSLRWTTVGDVGLGLAVDI